MLLDINNPYFCNHLLSKTKKASKLSSYMSSSAGYAGYYPSHEPSDTANPDDYLLSPVLSPPEWPPNNEFTETYNTSPLPSPGLCSPQDFETQNYFEGSCLALLQPSSMTSPTIETSRAPSVSYQQVVSQSDWNPNWTRSISPVAPSYMPFSLVSPHAEANDDGLDIIEGQTIYPSCSSSVYTGENFKEIAFKPAWGSSNETRRHSSSSQSKSGRRSSRVKEKGQANQSKRFSFSSSSKGHQLRSTRAGQKIKYCEKDEHAQTETTKNSRTSHNMVEKQYRNRLNGQFSTLLGAIPPELVGAEVEGYGRDSSGAEKKVSKADVLVLAKRHIRNLEREKQKLESGNGVLFQDMQRLKGAWVDMGGQVLP